MAGKGRPTVDDKRDNQYRVRLNDEENQMLAYCSQMTGQPKSQIFRKALEEYYQTVQLNEMEMGIDGISMRRVIKCPHCGAANAIALSDYSTGGSMKVAEQDDCHSPHKIETQGGTSYGAFSTAIWDRSDEKEIAGDHPDADGLGGGVCLFLFGIY